MIPAFFEFKSNNGKKMYLVTWKSVYKQKRIILQIKNKIFLV